MDVDEAVRTHYVTDESLVARVTAIAEGMTPEAFAAASDAGFDQFHLRGMAATAELAALARIGPASRVLDAGSGFGGPARYLAKTFGCRVAGIDLTPAFVAIARRFVERMGLADRVSYDVGDLAALPYGDAAFDVVWTQHVVMNVPDRERVYGEFRRVLRPDGIVAFYDVVAADGEPPVRYPVPWADARAQSFLLTKDRTIAAFEVSGLRVTDWQDLTDAAIEWFGLPPAATPPQLGLPALMGPRFGAMSANFVRNLREGTVRIAMGIATAAGPSAGRSR